MGFKDSGLTERAFPPQDSQVKSLARVLKSRFLSREDPGVTGGPRSEMGPERGAECGHSCAASALYSQVVPNRYIYVSVKRWTTIETRWWKYAIAGTWKVSL